MFSRKNEYEIFFSYLKSLNFHFLDTWVVDCVNYYKSIYPNISVEELKKEVKQQWLLVNLRDLKVSSLPPGLASKEKFILQGNYAVQVESVLDISESCFSQLQKFKGDCYVNTENSKDPVERNIKSNRCLLLDVTDGVQHLQAMEYQPIAKLKTNDSNQPPGFKIVILGPVECRRGIMLLKEENVRICGGEVDTLMACQSLKSVLCKKLNLSESDFPEDCISQKTKDDKIIEEDRNSYNQSVESLLSENDDVLLSLCLEPEPLVQTQDCNKKLKTECFDEIINTNLSDFSENNEFHQISCNKKHGLPGEDKYTLCEKKIILSSQIKMDCSILNSESVNENLKNKTEKFDSLKRNTNERKPKQMKLYSFFNCVESPETDLNVKEAVLNTSKKSLYPVPVDSEPFIYLKQIISVQPIKSIVFTIKATILTLTKKIAIKNDEFHLSASVTDGSFCAEVNFSSEIVELLLGFSPCEMTAMLKSKQTNSAVEARVKEAFNKAQQELITINCLMKIKCSPKEKYPVVVFLNEVDEHNLISLKKRKI